MSSSVPHTRLHSATPPSLIRSHTNNSSTPSIRSQPSSRDSGTTQGTSASALFPSPTSTPTSDPMSQHSVRPGDNVMNKVGEKEQSLFQICIVMRQRLSAVAGLEEEFADEEAAHDEADCDPVTLLWHTLRRGSPFIALVNVMFPEKKLGAQFAKITDDVKRGKAMTIKFLNVCISDVGFQVEQCFILNDLFGNDTTGFVRVTRCIGRILDLMVDRSLIVDTRRDSAEPFDSGTQGKRSQRQHIIAELVNTERTYVQQLELLQEYQVQCQKTGVVPGDIVHQIFLNLNGLLDFQRRFLIRVERINAQPEAEQNWGKLFQTFHDGFERYEPYITNQKHCEATVMREYDSLKLAGGSHELKGIVANPSTLYSFLMKPFQRLSKYPLLLGELIKKGEYDEERLQDLILGKECAAAILARTNEAMNREDLAVVAEELIERVDDWRNHRWDSFGELLLFGTYTVIKSDLGTNQVREYHMFFFETIILCCKEVDLNKAKNKMKARSLIDKKGKPKLHLKGRIFMRNVTDVLSAAKQDSYSVQVFWNGDNSVENFVIQFTNEDQMKKWYTKLSEQKAKMDAEAAAAAEELHRTSQTDFIALQGQYLENPYRQSDDDSDSPGGLASPIEYSSAWNQSQTSFRSRSTTGDSARMPPPPRSYPGQHGLTIRTQQLSPTDPNNESYFSPTDESPMSSRTSVSSAMYGPPRHGHFSEGAYMNHVPYRSASKEGMNQQGYPAAARQIGRPTHQSSASAPSNGPPSYRIRSASNPSMHEVQRRVMTDPRPPMPDGPFPPSLHRSHTGSPQVLSGGIDERLGMSPAMRFSSSTTGYPASRGSTPVQYNRDTMTPPPFPPQSPSMDMPPPDQLKIKVHAVKANQVLTLVVPSNITFIGLRDKIDAKLQRSTTISLTDRGAEHLAKLKYVDDNDYINIGDDEDVQNAFETWREQRGPGMGNMGEIELYCI